MFTLLPLLFACVVRYGEPVETVVTEQLPDPVSFVSLEEQFATLLVGQEDLQRISRLEAALDLARHMKSQDPRAQQVVFDFLALMLEIEQKDQPIDVWNQLESSQSFSLDIGDFQEEVIGEGPIEPGLSTIDVEIMPIIEPEQGPSVELLMANAREQLASGDPYAAMEALEICMDEACWDEVSGTWVHARDLYIYQRREQAAELFLRAQVERDPGEKLRQMNHVHQMLDELMTDYPDTRYGSAIQRNITMVVREISRLEE